MVLLGLFEQKLPHEVSSLASATRRSRYLTINYKCKSFVACLLLNHAIMAKLISMKFGTQIDYDLD